MSLLEEQCKPSSLPQDGQPSRKATHKYLRKTYRFWVSVLRLLATSVLLFLRDHIIFQVRLSLTHDRCKISIMTSTRTTTPTVLPQNFSWPWRPTLPPERPVHRWALWRGSCPCPCSRLIPRPEIGQFTRLAFFFFSEPLRGVEACLSFASLNGRENVQRECSLAILVNE